MSELKKRTISENGKEETSSGYVNEKASLKPSTSTPPSQSKVKGLISQGLSGIGIILILNFLCSYLLTETFTWGYKNRYTNWRNYVPRKNKIFTEQELLKYDGSDPSLPIYIAINGEVYDVTSGASYYGKGGGYSFFSGKDAARAYVTGCFKTHLTHDLRGFDEIDMEQVEGWMDFYRDHETYYRVGTVIHPPIDPNSPIPEDCTDDGKRRDSETIQKAND